MIGFCAASLALYGVAVFELDPLDRRRHHLQSEQECQAFPALRLSSLGSES